MDILKFVWKMIERDRNNVGARIRPEISVLEYLPIAQHSLCGGGTACASELCCTAQRDNQVLVDVGKQAALDKKLVMQGPGGFSMATLHTAKFADGVPVSSTIDGDTQNDYLANNPCLPARQRQLELELERIRHGDPGISSELRAQVEADAWVPPLGHKIHHFPLTPPATTQNKPERRPMLGVAYMLRAPDHNLALADAARLYHAAYLSAHQLIENRIEMLLWKKEDLFAEGENKLSQTDLPRTLARFLFAHHWFYPHEPSAVWLLNAICGDDSAALQNRYENAGWPAPPAVLLAREDEWKRQNRNRRGTILLDNLIDDFKQLVGYTHRGRAIGMSDPDLRNLLWTVAIVLAAPPTVGRLKPPKFIPRAAAKWPEKVITLFPATESDFVDPDVRCQISVFKTNALRDTLVSNDVLALAGPRIEFEQRHRSYEEAAGRQHDCGYVQHFDAEPIVLSNGKLRRPYGEADTSFWLWWATLARICPTIQENFPKC